jgi:spermidine synthase
MPVDGGWFAEPARAGFKQAVEIRQRLWSGHSGLQQIEILDTVPFGRALILDDAVQTTEADEFCYHELLVHIPLCAHPSPRRVVVIGGGDGGCLRHVLMHAVERAVQVEIDAIVIRACKEWMPSLAEDAFDDPRAELIVGDGIEYVRGLDGEVDAILVDSTDPVGPAEGLISLDFFRDVRRALRPGGLFAIQAGSPLLMHQELVDVHARVADVFPVAAPYLGHVPAYPGGLWAFVVGSTEHDPREPRRPGPAGSRYYSAAVHRGAFAMPPYLQSSLERGGGHGPARRPLLG